VIASSNANAEAVQEAEMERTVPEELARVRLLLEKGEYREALTLVESLRAREGLAMEDRLICSLFEARIRVKLGDLEEAHALAEEVLQGARGREASLLDVDALLVQAEVSWRVYAPDEGFEAVEKGAALLERWELDSVGVREEEVQRRKGELLRHRGILYRLRGDLDEARACLQQSLAIHTRLDNRQGMAACLNGLGWVYWSKGNYGEAIEHARQSLTIREELGNQDDIALSLHSLGYSYWFRGDPDRALKYAQRSLTIREKVGNRRTIAISLRTLGGIHLARGDLDQALEYNQRGLAPSQELGDKRGASVALSNLGEVYREKGDLDRSLAYHRQSLALREEQGSKELSASALRNLGVVDRLRGDLDRALEHFQRSLAIYEETGNDLSMAVVLYHLVGAACDSNNPARAQLYLGKLEQINERMDSRLIDQTCRVARAVALKASKRARDKLLAQEILEEVVEEPITHHSLAVEAMLHLCDLYLLELKMTEEEEVLAEVTYLALRLLEIGEQISSQLLLAETYLILSKLALVRLDVERAQELLAQARLLAEEKDLHELARRAAQEGDLLQSQLSRWQHIVEQRPSPREMIDLTQLDDLLEQMIRKTITTLSSEEHRVLGGEARERKYQLAYLDLLKGSQKTERDRSRVGIAQIGLSQEGQILQEFYEEQDPGLFGLREDKVEAVRASVRQMVEAASAAGVDLLVFPEMTVDLNHSPLLEEVLALARTFEMTIVPGSYHDRETRGNVSAVISPDGILWEQEKHIPAMIRFGDERMTEGIDVGTKPRCTVIGDTEFGRMAIIICRDFLDMDLRVELKNAEPAADLILNPAFTPVTADFWAAHFDARRSIYAYCFFANVAEFGDSLIYTPEKERVERTIPAGEEGLIYKDIDLFQLRSERKKWEIEQRKTRGFIQSTR
jgi:tetratricopeptide (TPR) repeat protein/predicted amidohydrolase